MLRVLLLYLLSGCNLAFPLSPAPTDGSPPTDGPIGSVECPAFGTAPRYGSELFTRAPSCFEYTEDLTGHGLASCGGSFAEIPLDDAPISIPIFKDSLQTQYRQPRLAPEGGQIFTLVRDDATGLFTIQTSVKSGTEWGTPSLVTAPNEPQLLTAVLGIGTPTTGPRPRMMINTSDGIHEVEVNGLDMRTVETYGFDDLGFMFIQTPNLTSDGLRAVGQGVGESEQPIFYLERESLDVPFETAVRIEGAPISNDVFMTSNCARLYAASAGKVLFARQL